MTYLLWPQEVDVDIGVSGGRINAVMAEVFTHVLWGGLRQQPINAFPWENNTKKKVWGFVLVHLFYLGFVVVWGFWFLLAGLRFCSVFVCLWFLFFFYERCITTTK